MTAILVLLLIVLVGLLITRIAAAALMATGMSRQFARFQSRSAFTGVGFTTSEAEMVVAHPVRRRVVMVLMLLGNAGIASVVATLLIGFGDSTAGQTVRRSIVLVFGLAGIWLLASNERIDRLLRRAFVRLLGTSEEIHLHDYAGLLHVGRDYTVAELHVGRDDWMAERTLAELELRNEGISVLGIERDGMYLGAPTGQKPGPARRYPRDVWANRCPEETRRAAPRSRRATVTRRLGGRTRGPAAGGTWRRNNAVPLRPPCEATSSRLVGPRG